MKNLNITKGEWSKGCMGEIFTSLSKCKIAQTFAYTNTKEDETEAESNAELICEAGNVANETGLTPRELLNQRDELLYVLSNLIIDARANNDFGCDSNLQSSVESAVNVLINNDLLPK